MKNGYERVEVSSKEEYEQTYRAVKYQVKSLVKIYCIYCVIAVVAVSIIYIVAYFVVDYVVTIAEIMSLILGSGITILLLIRIAAYPWHDNLYEGGNRAVYTKKLSYGFAVFLAICIGIGATGSILGFISVLLLLIFMGDWWLAISEVELAFNAVILSLLWFHLNKYFRWYRWTWEELQLSSKERKAQYKEKRLAEKQRMKEVREELRRKAQSSRAESRGFFAKNNEKPAAKIVKSQTDRRAELENLKKLYDEGLIDEEEYKKAREKALDIQ